MRNKRDRNRGGIKNKAVITLPLLSILIVGLIYFYADSFKRNWDFEWDGISTPIKDVVISLEVRPIQSIAIRDSFDDKEWLIKSASKEELLSLTEYPNAAIRATAYEGLLRQGHSDAYNLLLKAFHDNGEFALYITEAGNKRHYTIGEYLIDKVLLLDLTMNLPPRPNQKKQLDYNFTDEELKVIDSLYSITTFKYE